MSGKNPPHQCFWVRPRRRLGFSQLLDMFQAGKPNSMSWMTNIVEVDFDSGNQGQAVDRLVDLGRENPDHARQG